jgi:hypothetical protein
MPNRHDLRRSEVRATSLLARSSLGLAVTAGAVLGVAGPARAETAEPPAVQAAWYWAEKTASTPVTTLPTLPDPANAASGIPDGDLGVGYLTDQLASRDKMAAVDFDLTSIPAGAVFTSFQVTVPIDTAAASVQGTPADISACENIDVFTDGPAPQPIGAAPPYAAPTCVKGVLSSASAYVFDLTAIANEWSQGTPAHGISIVPTLLATTDMRPFSLALKGKNAITTKAVWSPPVTAPQPVTPVVASVAPPPVLPGGAVPITPAAPVLPAPQTAPEVPAPQANPAPQTVAVRPAAYAPRSLVPSTQWWLAVLAVAGLLGLAWITQSDPLVPVPPDARRARFSARFVRATRTA